MRLNCADFIFYPRLHKSANFFDFHFLTVLNHLMARITVGIHDFHNFEPHPAMCRSCYAEYLNDEDFRCQSRCNFCRRVRQLCAEINPCLKIQSHLHFNKIKRS